MPEGGAQVVAGGEVARVASPLGPLVAGGAGGAERGGGEQEHQHGVAEEHVHLPREYGPSRRARSLRPGLAPVYNAPAGGVRSFRLTASPYFDRYGNVKAGKLAMAKLEASETHVEAFRALAHLTRLQG